MPWRVWAVIVLAGAVGGALGLAATAGIAWPGSRAENVFGGAAVGLVAAGDKVVLRWTSRATHRGELRVRDWVVPATGRSVTSRGLRMYQVREGQLVAQWLGEDFLDVFLQLGATLTLPEPRAA